MKPIAWMLAAVLAAGCATQVTPGRMQAAGGASLELKQAVSWERVIGLYDARWIDSLSAGAYVPAFQDNAGVYYRGPRYCHRSRLVAWGAKPVSEPEVEEIVKDCAIHVPHDAAQAPKVYVMLHSDRWIRVPASSPNRGSVPMLDLQSRVELGETIRAGNPTLANAGPAVTAAGTAIGLGIVEALIEAERGNFIAWPWQPQALREALLR